MYVKSPLTVEPLAYWCHIVTHLQLQYSHVRCPPSVAVTRSLTLLLRLAGVAEWRHGGPDSAPGKWRQAEVHSSGSDTQNSPSMCFEQRQGNAGIWKALWALCKARGDTGLPFGEACDCVVLSFFMSERPRVIWRLIWTECFWTEAYVSVKSKGR